ncbi:MAG: phenylalanine--tRNA ligase subunit beta [Deltaproteobacteria bacterium]|nr:phenylalanine--tRNA ligase subunit beta [Deltaproteobacteria bacterium]
MRISLQWLKTYVDVAESPEDLAHRLTMGGLEVGSVERLGEGISDVVVGQILEKGRHPDADRLSLCRVTDGAETYDIVCGATNMVAGDKVALARVGAKLPGGVEIRKAKIRGQTSLGMMCSERELGLSEGHEGILILPAETGVGERLVDVLGLPDAILEVEITPNRPDCLSLVGVAREVVAITGRELRIPSPRVPESGSAVEGQTSVEILAPDLCHRYAARLIRGVRIGPSPSWMRRRLLSAGVRSINNVVDVTNYVLLELGHPLHAFDFARLRGGRIVVKRAGEGEVFTTLDGQARRLDSESLVICDGEGAVALAGIMGGLNSEVGDDTVDVLLESAYFLPTNIRRTSKALGLRTEASYRFERGADVEGLVRALDRSAELIVELAGGSVAKGVWDAYPTPHPVRRIDLRVAKIASVLGVAVEGPAAARAMESLGLRVTGRTDEALEVEVGSHRVDLEREIDLIEEVARVRGYDGIPETLPRVPMSSEPPPRATVLADAARDRLAGLGLREAITYSFIDPREDDRLALPASSPLRPKVVLQNPLSSETAVLRTSLLPGLLQAASLNTRRQLRDVRLFEVGRTFHPREGADLPTEVLRAGAVITGRRHPLAWWAPSEPADFYDGKGAVEELLAGLGVRGVVFDVDTGCSWLQPGRAARVRAGERDLGWCGEVHPACRSAYEIPAAVVAFEIDLEAASAAAWAPDHFAGLARYPSVERDLAFLVGCGVSTRRFLDVIAEVRSPLVRSVVLFDAFEGGRLPPGTVSLAFRVTYRADDRTLTEAEVSDVEKIIAERVAGALGARLRDA